MAAPVATLQYPALIANVKNRVRFEVKTAANTDSGDVTLTHNLDDDEAIIAISAKGTTPYGARDIRIKTRNANSVVLTAVANATPGEIVDCQVEIVRHSIID